MRLKVIFSPVAFFIAIVVSIWYIWPAVQEIIAKKGEINAAEVKYNATVDKKNNIEILKGSLDKNKEKEDFILNYLPSSRSDEKIVDSINYIAIDSGINLTSLSLTEEKVNNPIAMEDVSTSANSSDPTMMNLNTPKVEPKFLSVKAALSGKYENIKMFLKQIYKTGTFNEIISLSISKEESAAQSGDQANTSSDILTADVELKFGYMPLVHSEGGSYSEVFSKSSFDFGPYSKLSELATKSVPPLSEGQKGKSNPFLP